MDCFKYGCDGGPSRRPLSFYFAEFSVVMFSCNSSTYYYDESKPSRSKRPFASQHDYQIILKAELEIRHLHEKMDHLLSHQWERLAHIQEIQLDLLAEMNKKR